MKASNVLRLNAWVQAKRQWIGLEQPSQKQMASQAETDLGFKVSVSCLREMLLANNIQTRRQSKQVAEIALLKEQIGRQRNLLTKVATISTLPGWIRTELEAEGLGREVTITSS